MQVLDGAYVMDCEATGFDELLEYMRCGHLPCKLSPPAMVRCHVLCASVHT